MSARTFIVSRDDQDEAYEVAFRLAAVLVRYGITDRYGVAVRPCPSRQTGWGVHLVDRMPDLPYPARLTFVTVNGRRRALVAELFARAA